MKELRDGGKRRGMARPGFVEFAGHGRHATAGRGRIAFARPASPPIGCSNPLRRAAARPLALGFAGRVRSSENTMLPASRLGRRIAELAAAPNAVGARFAPIGGLALAP
ncbi:MAG TPA: hypothetical protein VNK67_03565 [Burkholderiales bacterium]|nr:hypothetical protein [Burkholderiales bacterium]